MHHKSRYRLQRFLRRIKETFCTAVSKARHLPKIGAKRKPRRAQINNFPSSCQTVIYLKSFHNKLRYALGAIEISFSIYLNFSFAFAEIASPVASKSYFDFFFLLSRLVLFHRFSFIANKSFSLPASSDAISLTERRGEDLCKKTRF